MQNGLLDIWREAETKDPSLGEFGSIAYDPDPGEALRRANRLSTVPTTGPVDAFFTALTHEMQGKPAMVMRGATAYTPGEAFGVDERLRMGALGLDLSHTPQEQAKFEKLMEGPLWPKGVGEVPDVVNSWAAQVGAHIPTMAMTRVAQALGWIAGGVGALATAGPDPTDVVTAPAVAKGVQTVSKHVLGAAPLVAMEAGGFLDEATLRQIDRDIAEKWARRYGLGSGIVEYLQVLWNLKTFKRLGAGAKGHVMKRLFTELVGDVWEGAEEWSQQTLQNRMMAKAVEEMRARHPDYQGQAPDILEGAGRSFAVGTGLGVLTRGAGRVSGAGLRAVAGPGKQPAAPRATMSNDDFRQSLKEAVTGGAEAEGMKATEVVAKALAEGAIDQGRADLLNYLLTEVDPDFDENSSIEIVDKVVEATDEILAAEGVEKEEGARYAVLGETVSNHQKGALQTAVRLFRGHDSDSIVEEWFHRFYDRLSPEERTAYDAYHEESGDARPVNEHFGQEGRDYFFSAKLHEKAGPIRHLFERARQALRVLVGRVRTMRGAQIPEPIENLYRAAGTPQAGPAAQVEGRAGEGFQVRGEKQPWEMTLRHRGVTGDNLLNAIDLAKELVAKGGEIHSDATVTLFHRTSPDAAERIIKTGQMISKEDRLFFGTRPTGEIEGYGDAVVRVRLPLEKLELNDVFTNEAHVTMMSGPIGRPLPVLAGYPDLAQKAEKPSETKAEDFGLREREGEQGGLFRSYQVRAVDAGLGPEWYSKMLMVVDEKMPRRMPAKALGNMLKKAGVKDEEIYWTGIEKLIDKGGMVTKEAVKETVAQNEINVVTEVRQNVPDPRSVYFEETSEGEWTAPDLPPDVSIRRMGRRYVVFYGAGDIVTRGGREYADFYEALAKAQVLAVDRMERETDDTQYERYTLPGGTNYQEQLLTLHRPQARTRREKELDEFDLVDRRDQVAIAKKELASLEGVDPDAPRLRRARDGVLFAEAALKRAEAERGESSAAPESFEYSSQHWETENIVVHVRHKDRKDPSGKKVLFIEEIQSDWHQAGREKGYSSGVRSGEPHTYDQFGIARDRASTLMSVARLEWYHGDGDAIVIARRGPHPYHAREGGVAGNLTALPSTSAQVAVLVPHREVDEQGQGFRVEERLYEGVELTDKERAAIDAHKRFVRIRLEDQARQEAIPDAPYKRTWPELALKRMVRWASERGYDRLAWTTGKQQIDRYEETLRQGVDEIRWEPQTVGRSVVTVWKNDEQVLEFTYQPEDGIITAADLNVHSRLEGKHISEVVGKEIAQTILSKPEGVASGPDLTIGGHGMTTFYDRIVPNAANKVVKKWGVKVKRVPVRIETEYMAEENRREAYLEPVWAIDLTDEMKDSALRVGMPSYQVREEPSEITPEGGREGAKSLYERRPEAVSRRPRRLEDRGGLLFPEPTEAGPVVERDIAGTLRGEEIVKRHLGPDRRAVQRAVEKELRSPKATEVLRLFKQMAPVKGRVSDDLNEAAITFSHARTKANLDRIAKELTARYTVGDERLRPASLGFAVRKIADPVEHLLSEVDRVLQPPKVVVVTNRRELVREAKEDVESDRSYQEGVDVAEEVQAGSRAGGAHETLDLTKKYSVGLDRYPGEVIHFIGKPGEKGGKHYLWRYITTQAKDDRAPTWDEMMNAWGIEGDVEAFLEILDQAVIAQRESAGLNTAAVNFALDMGEMEFAAKLTKYRLLKEGDPVEAVNAGLVALAEEYDLTAEDVADLFVQETKTKRRKTATVTETMRSKVMSAVRQAVAVGHGTARKELLTQHKRTLAEMRRAQTATKEIRQKAVGLVKRLVPLAEQHRFLTNAANATTPKDLNALAEALGRFLPAHERRLAKASLAKTISTIRRKMKKTRQEGGLEPEYAETINRLLELFQMAAPSKRTLRGARSLADYLDRLRGEMEGLRGEDYAELLVPRERLTLLARVAKMPVSELGAQEIRLIEEELKHLVHLSETKSRIILFSGMREAAELLNGAVTEARSARSLRRETDELSSEVTDGDGLYGTIWAHTAGYKADDLETLIERINGARTDGELYRLIEEIREGREHQAAHKRKVTKYVHGILKKHGISISDLQTMSPSFYRWLKAGRGMRLARRFLASIGGVKAVKRHKVTLAGRKVVLTTAEVMSIYMHAQAEWNVRAMIEDGLAFPNRKIGRISPSELVAVLKLLGPKEIALCKAADHVLETMDKPAINEVSLELDGVEKAAEPDYWHVERRRPGRALGRQTYRLSLLEGAGWLKPREGGGYPLIIRDFFDVLFTSVDGVAEYVGMAKPLRLGTMLLSHAALEETVDGKGKRKYLRAMRTLLGRIQGQKEVDSTIGSLLALATRGAVRSVLAVPYIALSQYTSTALYVAEVNPEFMTALRLLDTKATRDEIDKYWNSAALRREGGMSSVALGTIAKQDRNLRAATGKAVYANWLTGGIHAVDARAVQEAWRIAKKEADAFLKEGKLKGRSGSWWNGRGIDGKKGSPEYWAMVRRRADFIMRRTQPMFDVEGRSVQTSERHPLARAFTMFRSYTDQLLRIMHRSRLEVAEGKSSPANYARAYGAVMMSLATSVLLRSLVKCLMYKRKPDLEDILGDLALAPLKMPVFIGHLLLSVARAGYDTALGRAPKYRDVELTTLPQETIALLGQAGLLFMKAGGEATAGTRYKSGARKGRKKAPYTVKAAAKVLGDALGLWFGLPVRATRRVIESWTEESEASRAAQNRV